MLKLLKSWFRGIVKDWLRGLGIVVLVAILAQVAIEPLWKLINKTQNSPLFNWMSQKYVLFVVLFILFLALPIAVSKSQAVLRFFIRTILKKRAKRGWKAGSVPVEKGEAPCFITGCQELIYEDGKSVTRHVVLIITSPTPVTGFPRTYSAEEITIYPDISPTEWGSDAIYYFSNRQKKTIRAENYAHYLERTNQAP